MPTAITAVQNDKGYTINFTLTDAQNIAVDLTGATLTIEGQLISDYAVVFTGTLAAVIPASGTCKYIVQTTDFTVSGTYNAQITATYGSGEVLTWSNIQFTIEPKLPLV